MLTDPDKIKICDKKIGCVCNNKYLLKTPMWLKYVTRYNNMKSTNILSSLKYEL